MSENYVATLPPLLSLVWFGFHKLGFRNWERSYISFLFIDTSTNKTLDFTKTRNFIKFYHRAAETNSCHRVGASVLIHRVGACQ